jgi:hypothetical protein
MNALSDQELDALLDTWSAPELPRSLRAPAAATKRAWRPWAAAAAVVLVCGAAVGTSVISSEPELGATWASLSDGTQLRVRTLATPWYSALQWTGLRGQSATGGSRHLHCVADPALRWYTCYEAIMHRAAPSASYSVAVREWRLREDELTRRGWHGARFVPPPDAGRQYSPRPDESFEIALWKGSDGERLWDRLTLSGRAFDDEPSKRPLGTGPFGAAEMRFSHPRLFLQGRLVAEADMEARGLSLWFRLPGRGEWRLAVDAGGHAGYLALGFLEGRVLEFTQGGEVFRIECEKPVTRTSGRRPLYVWFRPDASTGEDAAPFGSAGPAAMMEP